MRALVLIALWGGWLSAHAVESVFDCKAALADHATRQRTFTRWSYLSDLDGPGDATLLIRARGPEHIGLVSDPRRARLHPELSFTADGNAYAVVSGQIENLRTMQTTMAAMNKGRRLSFQVLERDGVHPTTLGEEITLRAPFAPLAAKPFKLVDDWLSKFKTYQRARHFVVTRTERIRTGLAERLQARRNPRVPVAGDVLAEVRECLAPGCVAPVNAGENMVFRRLEAFFAKHVPGTSLRQATGLEIITHELLDRIAPERHAENAELVDRRKLGLFDFTGMSREARMFYLMRAYELIEARTWPDEASRPVNMFNIERTLREYERLVALPHGPRQLALDIFVSPEVAQEFANEQLDWLRKVLPLTVVRGPEDYAWVVVEESYAREHADTLIADVAGALGRPIRSGVAENLAAPSVFLNGHPTELTLKLVAHQQLVARMKTTSGPAYLVIPAPLRPRVQYAADLAWIPSRLTHFENVIHSNLDLALTEQGGGFRQIYTAEDGTSAVDYTLAISNDDRPLIRVTSVRAVTRDEAVPMYRRIAERYGITTIDVGLTDDRQFSYDDKPIRRVRMDDYYVAESRVSHGLDAEEIEAALSQMKGASPIDDRRCADVEAARGRYEVCFGSIISGFAKIKSVRRK